MTDSLIVECSNLVKLYGEQAVVNDLSLALYPGEILSILGPSGSGKTTTLRLIAGLEAPEAGEISIQGRLVSGPSTHVPPDRRNVGMVFQEYALFPHKTVAQNISFGLQRQSSQEREQRLQDVVELVRLSGLEDRYPHELSGGQQQRVALARTVAPEPVTVLLDEPFSNLDANMRREMRQEVEAILRQHDISTVFVTHDREEAFAMADRVGVMNNGHLEQLDTPEMVYRSPSSRFVAELTGLCDFLDGEVSDNLVITELGKLSYVGTNGALPDRSKVDVLVHPDDFQLTPHAEGTSDIVSREFRGDETILVVRTPSGATLRCRQSSSSTLAPGSKAILLPKTADAFLAFQKYGD